MLKKDYCRKWNCLYVGFLYRKNVTFIGSNRAFFSFFRGNGMQPIIQSSVQSSGKKGTYFPHLYKRHLMILWTKVGMYVPIGSERGEARYLSTSVALLELRHPHHPSLSSGLKIHLIQIKLELPLFFSSHCKWIWNDGKCDILLAASWREGKICRKKTRRKYTWLLVSVNHFNCHEDLG